MKMNEAIETLITIARQHGFTADGGDNISFVSVKGHHVNIVLNTRLDFEAQTMSVEISVFCNHMGGNPTVAELLADADELKRGAQMMDEFNSLGITIQMKD